MPQGLVFPGQSLLLGETPVKVAPGHADPCVSPRPPCTLPLGEGGRAWLLSQEPQGDRGLLAPEVPQPTERYLLLTQIFIYQTLRCTRNPWPDLHPELCSEEELRNGKT